jgi:hypothetical protein
MVQIHSESHNSNHFKLIHNLMKTKKHSPRLLALLYFVQQAPKDRHYNPVVEIIDTDSLGFFYAFKN